MLNHKSQFKDVLYIRLFVILFSVLFCLFRIFIYLPFDLSVFVPNLNIHFIFIATLFVPGSMTPFILTFLGMVEDIMFGYVLGFNALKYIILFWVVEKYRKPYVFSNFAYTWIGFGICLLALSLYNVMLNILLNKYEIKYFYMTIDYIISMLAFPLILRSIELVFTKPKKIKI